MKMYIIWLTLSLWTTQALAAGGVDGGGGDVTTTPQMPINYEQLQGEISRVSFNSLYVLRLIESSQKHYFIARFPPDPKEEIRVNQILQKLFGDGSGLIYQKLKDVKWELSQNPCLAQDGSERDASVSSDLSSICFNFERISSKISWDNYQIKLMGLWIHELSHLMGTTEDEADLLQESVESSVQNNLGETIIAYRRDAERDFEVFHFLINKIKNYAKMNRIKTVCSTLIYLYMPLRQPKWVRASNGALLPSLKFQYEFENLDALILNAYLGFCQDQLDEEMNVLSENLKKAYDESSTHELKADEFDKLVWRKNYSNLDPNLTIHEVGLSNIDDLNNHFLQLFENRLADFKNDVKPLRIFRR